MHRNNFVLLAAFGIAISVSTTTDVDARRPPPHLRWNQPFVPHARRPYVATTVPGVPPPGAPGSPTQPDYKEVCAGVLPAVGDHETLGWKLAWSSSRRIRRKPPCSAARHSLLRSLRSGGMYVGGWKCKVDRSRGGGATCVRGVYTATAFEFATVRADFLRRRVGSTKKPVKGVAVHSDLEPGNWPRLAHLSAFLVVGRGGGCAPSAIGASLQFAQVGHTLVYANTSNGRDAWFFGSLPPGTYGACVYIQTTARDRDAVAVYSARARVPR